jgi:predicted  nucleic acid-binding Zn-ribbon protein
MSLLAKVFIVLQTILIMTYLGLTGALYQHRRDWRTSYQKLKGRYSTMVSRSGKEIEALRNFVSAKNQLISAKENEITFLKSQLDVAILQAEQKGKALSAEKSRTTSLEAEATKDKSTIRDLGKQNTSLTEQNTTLKGDLDKATSRREIAEGQVARLTNLTGQLEADLGNLRETYAGTRKKLREKELLIAMAENQGVNFASLLPGPPVPAIDGRVLAVKTDVKPALVLLSVGADEKVEAGFRFSVYRGNKFIGKVVVERVLRDSAGCRVLFTAEGEAVQSGDTAATRLQ